MSKYLFIGGPKDGEYMDISDECNQWIIREVGNNLYDCKFGDYEYKPHLKFDFTEHVYVKNSLSGKNGRYFVFVCDKVPDVMETLLKGYRKRKSVKKKPKFY